MTVAGQVLRRLVEVKDMAIIRSRILLWVAAALLVVAAIGQPAMTAESQSSERWEYATMLIAWDPNGDAENGYYRWADRTDTEASLAAFLNRHGDDGWELVDLLVETTVPTTAEEFSTATDGDAILAGTDAIRWRAVFKRPDTGAA